MSDARSYVQLKRELGNWIAEGKYVLPLSAVATSLLMLEGEYADKWLVKGLPISIARSAARYCLQYEWGEEAHEFHFDLYVATKDDVGEDCFFIVGDLQADRVRSVLTDWLFYHPRIGVEPFVLWNKQFHSLLLRLRLSM